MSESGGPDLLIRTRTVLLDALEALSAHRESVVLIGAQAIYLHTGEAAVALPAATKDSDFVIHPRTARRAAADRSGDARCRIRTAP